MMSGPMDSMSSRGFMSEPRSGSTSKRRKFTSFRDLFYGTPSKPGEQIDTELMGHRAKSAATKL
jgi:hypothetical protein